MTTPPEKRPYASPEEAARIYLLPNLFTAGNMLCGFLAIKNCIEARFTSLTPEGRAEHYNMAVWFILFACVCDLFDGRVARATKRESLFGAEFDSIADTVSFGVAPALMACFLVIKPEVTANVQLVTWLLAFIYLLCAGVRLARFNVLTNPLVPGNEKRAAGGDFVGLPSPAAAGMIASLVLVLSDMMVSPGPAPRVHPDRHPGGRDLPLPAVLVPGGLPRLRRLQSFPSCLLAEEERNGPGAGRR